MAHHSGNGEGRENAVAATTVRLIMHRFKENMESLIILADVSTFQFSPDTNRQAKIPSNPNKCKTTVCDLSNIHLSRNRPEQQYNNDIKTSGGFRGGRAGSGPRFGRRTGDCHGTPENGTVWRSFCTAVLDIMLL